MPVSRRTRQTQHGTRHSNKYSLTCKAASRPDGDVDNEVDEVLALATGGGRTDGVGRANAQLGGAALACASNLDNSEGELAGGGTDLTAGSTGARARQTRRAVGTGGGTGYALVVSHDAFGWAECRGGCGRVGGKVRRLGENGR
jgi:hypothetical protein